MKPFEKHLKALRAARSEVDAALEIWCPEQKRAGEVLAQAWERLFDYFLARKEDPTLKEMSTEAGVILKLMQSGKQSAARELQMRKFEEERADAAEKKLAEWAKHPGLPPELRAELERELQLLG
jgi:hypothetical protein